MAQNSIWDDYLRNPMSGWSPPPGIEGEQAPPVVTSGNQAWRDAQPGGGGGGQPPFPNIPFTPSGNGNGGTSKSFFPAANQFINRPPLNLTTYPTPSGGSATVPTGSRVPNYAQGLGQSYFPAAIPNYGAISAPYQSGSLQGSTSNPLGGGGLRQFNLPSGGTATAFSKRFPQSRNPAPNESMMANQPTRYFDF